MFCVSCPWLFKVCRDLKGLTDRQTLNKVDAITAVFIRRPMLWVHLSPSTNRIPRGIYLTREILTWHFAQRLHFLSATHLSAVARNLTVYSSVPGFKLHFPALLDAAIVGNATKLS
jgi:hypothetical protein